MTEPVAYLNGRWIPAVGVSVAVTDAGFVQGVTITEQLRTFGGRLFCLDEHLDRFFRSLEIVQIPLPVGRAELASLAAETVERNRRGLDPADDLGLCLFATPGGYAAMSGGAPAGPTLCLHAYRLQYELWAEKFERGQAVVISSVKQVPGDCWSPELKCRSRMHYYLADQEARRREPGSRAILLDHEGFVSEATTASVLLVRASEGLVSPPSEKILPGISLLAIRRLAPQLGLPFVEREIRPEELAQADEVLLASTSVCVLPVVRCDGFPIGAGTPGPVYRRLLAAWSELVGLDVAGQARRFAQAGA